MMPPKQHPSPTSLKNSDPLSNHSKTLDPCVAFLLNLGGTAMLAILTIGLMVS